MTDYSKRKALGFIGKRFAKWMANPYYHMFTPSIDEENKSLYVGPFLRNMTALSIFELAKTAVTGRPPEFSFYQPVIALEGISEVPAILVGLAGAKGIKKGFNAFQDFWNNAKYHAKIEKPK